MTEDIHALSQLFGAYFHQDWRLEFEDDVATLKSMAASEPRNMIVAASQEMVKLLASGLDEPILARVVIEKFDCCFDPAHKRQTYAEWLSDALKILKIELAK